MQNVKPIPESRIRDPQERLAPVDRRASSHAGPPYDGGMEARIAKLEAAMEHAQRDIGEIKLDLRDLRSDVTGIRTTDFRLTFGAIIAVAVGLAGVMAKGFGWVG